MMQKSEIPPANVETRVAEGLQIRYVFDGDVVEEASNLVAEHFKSESDDLEGRIRLHKRLAGLMTGNDVTVEFRSPVAPNVLLPEDKPGVDQLEVALQQPFRPSDAVNALKLSADSAMNRIIAGYAMKEVPVTEQVDVLAFDDTAIVSSLFEQARINNLKKEQHRMLSQIPGPNEIIQPNEIARTMELYSPVKRLPKFADQAQDTTRTGIFEYAVKGKDKSVIATGTMTERDGLVELMDFLTDVAEMGTMSSNQIGSKYPNIRKSIREESGLNGRGLDSKVDEAVSEKFRNAKGIIENLSYLGEKEFNEAVRGVYVTWKTYLDGDERRKLCVLTGVGELERYQVKGARKSDDFLRDKVLGLFSDDELQEYSGRILTKVEDLEDEKPQNVRVVMIDDWVVSGKQMRDIYAGNMKNPIFRKYSNSGRVEFNFLVASRDRFENGLRISPFDEEQGSVPVRAYYLSHDAHQTAVEEHEAHVTGINSSVNYDFKYECAEMAWMLGIDQPGITSIVRQYRNTTPDVIVSKDRIERLSSGRTTVSSRKPGLIVWR